MTIDAYPLQWPAGWPRTAPNDRLFGRFNKKSRQYFASGGSYMASKSLSVSDGVQRVLQSLERMGVDTADDVVISTDLALRLDGLPRSGQKKPDDPGAAVYWVTPEGERRCMAIDLYQSIADNIAAIKRAVANGLASDMYRHAQAMMAVSGLSFWIHLNYFEDAEQGVRKMREHDVQFHPNRASELMDSMIRFTAKSRFRAGEEAA